MNYSALALGAYFALSAGCLAYHLTDAPFWLEAATKPLLMPMLGLFHLAKGRSHRVPFSPILLFALFWAWWGDVSLMFGGLGFFLAGLGGFLVMQLTYIQIYRRTSPATELQLLRRKPYLAVPILGLAAGAYALMFPNLPDVPMMIAVAVYALALSSMVLFAANRYEAGRSKTGYWWILGGASLFMGSDLMIGINRFYSPIPLSGFWIMITYIAAQYLIVAGLEKERG